MPKNSLEAKDCSPFRLNKKDLKKKLQALQNLCEYFENTNKGYEDTDAKIASLQRRWYKYDNDSEATLQTRWWADRYIGVAIINNVEISIRPRYGEKFLLSILFDLYNIKFVENHSSNENGGNEWFSNLMKLLRRRIWIDKCAKANRYGLPRMNIKREHQGVMQRGTLYVRGTVMPWLMKQEMCTYTYEKTLDDHICRIVYEANRLLSREIIGNGKNKNKNADGFRFSMPPTVQDTIDALNSRYKGSVFDLTENDYHRIRYKSIFQSWKPLVDYSWDIIRERQLGLKSSNSQNECVFVDMAEIWEAFLRKKLGEGLEGWRVWSVEECRQKIYEHTFFRRTIIPDILLERINEEGEKEFIVFDAKYKQMLGEKKNVKNSDVDRSDLFQIHTYIQYVQHCMGKVILGGLLYPLSVEINESNIGTFHSMQLFGFKDIKDKYEIPFIVDGVYCDEVICKSSKVEEVEKEMVQRVEEMINRIKNILNKPH